MASFHQENSAKDEKIKGLEASIAAVTAEAAAAAATATTASASDNIAEPSSASAQSPANAASARPTPATHSLSPTPGTGAPAARALSPTRGGAAASAAGAGGDDGSEASLRNKLIARSELGLWRGRLVCDVCGVVDGVVGLSCCLFEARILFVVFEAVGCTSLSVTIACFKQFQCLAAFVRAPVERHARVSLFFLPSTFVKGDFNHSITSLSPPNPTNLAAKRPLASTTSTEAAGPSKRVAPNSVAGGGGDTASGGAGGVAGGAGATPASQPIASSFTAPGQ